MQQLTVKTLLELCKKEIKKGNGDKLIVISDDNEGNGFHGLFYAFTQVQGKENKDYFKTLLNDTCETNLDNLLLLG